MGKIINGTKFIRLVNNNEFKNKSLSDNVYFTLRDIFLNSESIDKAMDANGFNKKLTGGICFEDRCNDFQYTNVLYESIYVEKLLRWLNNFNIHYFEFEEEYIDNEDNEVRVDIDLAEYIKFDDWWLQFEQLKALLEQQMKKCIQMEEEDAERDYNRLCELDNEE
jgi:hypothetical protein